MPWERCWQRMESRPQVIQVAVKNLGNYLPTRLISKELGKHYSELFEKRQKGDYNDFFDFDRETVLKLYPPSVEFVKEIEKQIAK
jgi:uncharacterized protein (UPF0332 family)